jgi:hypothetical protein
MKMKLKKKPAPAPPPVQPPLFDTRKGDPIFRSRDYLSRERMLFNHMTEDILKYGTPDQVTRAAEMTRHTMLLLDEMKLDYPKGATRAPRPKKA